MDCFKCLSVWVAVPIGFILVQKPIERVLTILALSGVACLVERLGQEPVIIQPVTQIENDKE